MIMKSAVLPNGRRRHRRPHVAKNPRLGKAARGAVAVVGGSDVRKKHDCNFSPLRAVA